MTTATRTKYTVRFIDELGDDLRGRKLPETDYIVAEACRQRPGVFAEVPLEGRQLTSFVAHVNHKGSKAFPVGEFRATQRDGQAYVRYIGK